MLSLFWVILVSIISLLKISASFVLKKQPSFNNLVKFPWNWSFLHNKIYHWFYSLETFTHHKNTYKNNTKSVLNQSSFDNPVKLCKNIYHQVCALVTVIHTCRQVGSHQCWGAQVEVLVVGHLVPGWLPSCRTPFCRCLG